jgi:MotA/TolQ/ExbB proton channel family
MEAVPSAMSDAPVSELLPEQRKRGRWLAVLGVVLSTGPIWGLVVTVFGMMKAFETMGNRDGANVDQLAGNIGSVLVSMAIGLFVGFLGAGMMVIALYGPRNRERWFYWNALLISVVWCVFPFPYGLIIGLPMGLMFFLKRREFFPKPA